MATITINIKEMAHEHVVAYMHNDEYEEMEDTYMAGANAVLEEIENFAETNFSDYLEPIKLLRDKIKELKGE